MDFGCGFGFGSWSCSGCDFRLLVIVHCGVATASVSMKACAIGRAMGSGALVVLRANRDLNRPSEISTP